MKDIKPIESERVVEGGYFTEDMIRHLYENGAVLYSVETDPETGEQVETPLTLEEILGNESDDGEIIEIDPSTEK